MKMIFAMRDAHGAPHVYRIDDSQSSEAIECLPVDWSDMLERLVLALSVLRWFGIEHTSDDNNAANLTAQMRDPNGWTISDDFRQWHAPDLVSPAPEVETGDWQGMDTTRHPDEPDGRDA